MGSWQLLCSSRTPEPGGHIPSESQGPLDVMWQENSALYILLWELNESTLKLSDSGSMDQSSLRSLKIHSTDSSHRPWNVQTAVWNCTVNHIVLSPSRAFFSAQGRRDGAPADHTPHTGLHGDTYIVLHYNSVRPQRRDKAGRGHGDSHSWLEGLQRTKLNFKEQRTHKCDGWHHRLAPNQRRAFWIWPCSCTVVSRPILMASTYDWGAAAMTSDPKPSVGALNMLSGGRSHVIHVVIFIYGWHEHVQ